MSITAIITSPLTVTLVELAAMWSRKALEANALLAQAHAEQREPTVAEVQAVLATDDEAAARFQANIDKHADVDFAKVRITPDAKG